MGLAGACVFTRPADSPLDTPWKHRTIFASNSTTLFVSPSWGEDQPAANAEYMIGPIEFLAEFKPRNYDTDDFQKRDWQQIVTHVPETIASKVRVELIPDLQNSDPEEGTVTDADGAVGKGREFSMDWTYGRQIAPVGRLIHNFQQVRLRNFAPEEPVQILNQTLRITPKTSR